MVNALNTQFSALYAQQAFAPYTVAGQTTGQYKNAGTFSYVRIYGAGHEVPAYKVTISLCFFRAVAGIWIDHFIVWDIGRWASCIANVQSDYGESGIDPDMSPGPGWFLLLDFCSFFFVVGSYGFVN